MHSPLLGQVPDLAFRDLDTAETRAAAVIQANTAIGELAIARAPLAYDSELPQEEPPPVTTSSPRRSYIGASQRFLQYL